MPLQDETAEAGISGLLVDPWVQADLLDAYCANPDCYESVALEHPAVRLAGAALPWDGAQTSAQTRERAMRDDARATPDTAP